MPTPQQTPDMRETRSASRLASPTKGMEQIPVSSTAAHTNIAAATSTTPVVGSLRLRTVVEVSSPERLDIILSATERAEFDIPEPAVPRMRSSVDRPLVPVPATPVNVPHTSERSMSRHEQPSHVHSDEERSRPDRHFRGHSRSPPRSERRGRSPPHDSRRPRTRPHSRERPRSPIRAERHQRSPPHARARSRSTNPRPRKSEDSHSSRDSLH